VTLRPALLPLLTLAACVTGTSAVVKKDAAPERVAIANQSPFDVATCGPKTVAMPAASQASIIGALVMTQPALLECLVDPKARGAEAQTHVRVQANVVGTAATYEVTGQNLTGEGKACVEAMVRRQPLGTAPEGATATGAIELVHVAGVSPAVKFGVNEPSDVVGTIRLAQQKDFCECYQPLNHQPPPTLEATLKLAADKPAEVSVTPPQSASAKTVADCVQRKLGALALPKVTAPVELKYQFALLDSFADTQSESASPALQFAQLDAIRAQKNAAVAVAVGARDVAANAYDAAGAKYKAKPTSALIPELKQKCQAVLDADTAWQGALKELVGTTQTLVTFVQDLSLKDINWAEAASKAQEQLVKAQQDQANVDKRRQADEAACPKMK
jgi:hypothetical protein